MLKHDLRETTLKPGFFESLYFARRNGKKPGSYLYLAAKEAALRGCKPLYGGVVGVAINLYSSCFLPSTENTTNDF